MSPVRNLFRPGALLALALSALVLVGLAITLAPEPPARPLTPRAGWEIRGHAGVFPPSQLPPLHRHLRQSVVASPESILIRSWTPDAGIQEIEAISPPFRAPRYILIPVTGSTSGPSGRNVAYLTCSTHPHRRPIFIGNVNVAGVEAIVELPDNWCAGETRAHLVAGDKSANVGIGTVFEVSRISAAKTSFVGLLPYFALTMAIAGIVMWTGAALLRRGSRGLPSVPGSALTLAIVCLASFYAHAAAPLAIVPMLPILVAAGCAAAALFAGRSAFKAAASELRPYAQAWAVAAFAYFALLCIVDNGLGYWGPNYRFWPAAWSSDNELPWMFAEAVRNHSGLANLFGGGWKPTDRPPLMAGAYTLVAGAFGSLQAMSDGAYARGLAFNAAAVVLSSMWVPAVIYVLVDLMGLPMRRAQAVAVVAGFLPFLIFNSIYGWPKAFGAALGLAATGIAIVATEPDSAGRARVLALAFGALAALSMLAHFSGALFLLPVALWYFWRCLRHTPRALAAGALAGLGLLASWMLFQQLTLPSSDPVTKYALTGDPGFGTPGKSLLAMLADRYGAMSFAQWIEVKWRMALQPLLPLDTPVRALPLDFDFGVDRAGALRAWDLHFLSTGNSAALVAALVAAAMGGRRPVTGDAGGGARWLPVARLLIGWVAVAYLLLTLTFLAPLSLPHWPYAALLALVCGGLGAVALGRPIVFWWLGAFVIGYSSMVWIVAPLRAARDVDAAAAIAFAATAGWLIVRVVRSAEGPGRAADDSVRARAPASETPAGTPT